MSFFGLKGIPKRLPRVVGGLLFLCQGVNLLIGPICQNVSSMSFQFAAGSTTSQMVELCDLIRNRRKFGRRKVVIQAIALATFENQIIYDPKCTSDSTSIYLQAANPRAAENLAKQLKDVLTGPKRARFTLVGTLEGPSRRGYGHLNSAKYRFVVIKVLDSQPVAADTP